MIAVDADLLQALVHGAESACHLRAVGVGQLIGQRDQILLLGDHVLGHAAVALPAVGAAILVAGAGNHVAAPAVVAHAATGDVIDNDAIARFEAAAAFAHGHNLAAWLVPGDHALVTLGALAKMFVINAANVGPADGRRFHSQQNFPMTRLGHGH